MDTREALLAAAFQLLERDGQARFSTRAVCAIANVTAPTLYHHFGSADSLISAVITEAFGQLLAGKRASAGSRDPIVAFGEGWDTYVRFAAERPHLYAAMMARILDGADIPAAREVQALLVERITAIDTAGRLALPAEEATQLARASADAAALLHVTAALQGTGRSQAATDAAARLRDHAIQTICTPQPMERHA